MPYLVAPPLIDQHSLPATMSATTLFLADDHRMFLDGLRSIIEQESDLKLLGVATSGEEVLRFFKNERPDVLLIDISMPGQDGLEVTRKVTESYPEVRVIIVSMYNNQEFVSRSLEAGALGYLLKNTGLNELLLAIREVANGGTYYSGGLMESVLRGIHKERKQRKVKEEINLSERELEVLKLIVKELTNHEIAERLFLSPYTVETHRKNLLSKASVRNTAGLVSFAYKMGIVTIDE